MKQRPTRRRATLLCFHDSTVSTSVHSTLMRPMDVREAFFTALRAPDHPSSGQRGPCPTPSSFKREATAHRAIHPRGGLWRRCSRRRGHQRNKSTVGWIVLTWQGDPATDACQDRDSNSGHFSYEWGGPPRLLDGYPINISFTSNHFARSFGGWTTRTSLNFHRTLPSITIKNPFPLLPYSVTVFSKHHVSGRRSSSRKH